MFSTCDNFFFYFTFKTANFDDNQTLENVEVFAVIGVEQGAIGRDLRHSHLTWKH